MEKIKRIALYKIIGQAKDVKQRIGVSRGNFSLASLARNTFADSWWIYLPGYRLQCIKDNARNDGIAADINNKLRISTCKRAVTIYLRLIGNLRSQVFVRRRQHEWFDTRFN